MSFKNKTCRRAFLNIISVLVLWLLPFYLIGQQIKVDSLTELLKKSNKKEQVTIYLEIADIYINNKPKIAIKYAGLALKKAQEISDSTKCLIANEKIGNAYLLVGDFENAYKHFYSIINEIPSKDIKYNINLYTKKGNIYNKIGEFDKALLCYQNALKYGETINDSNAIASSYNDIGYILFLSQEYNNAKNYFHKAQNLFIKTNNLEGLSDSYNRIGIIYGETNCNDSALFYFKKALAIKKSINSTNKLLVVIDNIGEVFLQKNQPDSSLYYLNQSYQLLLKQNAVFDLSYVLNFLGKAYILKTDYKKAKSMLDESKLLALKYKYWYIYEIYATYADLYYKSREYKNAFDFLKLHYTLKDSIFNVKKKLNISELQVKYETNEKEKQIQLLNKEKELIQLNLRRKNIIIILSIIGIVIITILAFIAFVSLKVKKNANRLLNIKNKKIEMQKQEIILKNDLLEKQKEEILSQKESLEETNLELAKINVYLEKLSHRNLHTDLAVMIASVDKKVERVNFGFFKMYGYSSENFISAFPLISNWYKTEEDELINQAILTKENINFETSHLSYTENIVFVQTTIIPLLDESNKIIKLVIIETEISKL